MLPNIVGETYSGLVKPSANLHCEVCKDDRNWDVMILCDNCDSGWHTYCLLPPLDDVPEGDWLCPHCVDNGMTMEKLAQKQVLELRLLITLAINNAIQGTSNSQSQAS
jgi:hypothetical protein